MQPRKKLGELLIEAGVIDQHQLLSALAHQKQWGVKVGQALVDLKIATELQIVDSLSKKLGYEAVRLDRLEPSPVLDAALKLVPRELARSQNLLPLAADANSVTLAMSDPTNVAIVDEIAFRTGKRIRIVISGDREIARCVRRLYFPEELARRAAIEVPTGGEPLETTDDWMAAMPPGVRQELAEEHFIDLMDGEPAADDARAATAGPAAPHPAARAEPLSTGSGQVVEARKRNGTHAVPAASEAVLLDVIDRMVRGERAPGGLEPGRLVAATVRVLLRKGLVGEAELLAELVRK